MTCHICFWNFFLIVWFTSFWSIFESIFLLIHKIPQLIINFFNGKYYTFKILPYSSNIKSRCFKLFGLLPNWCWIMTKRILLSWLFVSTLPAWEVLTALTIFIFLRIWSSPGFCSTLSFSCHNVQQRNRKYTLVKWSRTCLLCS